MGSSKLSLTCGRSPGGSAPPVRSATSFTPGLSVSSWPLSQDHSEIEEPFQLHIVHLYNNLGSCCHRYLPYLPASQVSSLCTYALIPYTFVSYLYSFFPPSFALIRLGP